MLTGRRCRCRQFSRQYLAALFSRPQRLGESLRNADHLSATCSSRASHRKFRESAAHDTEPAYADLKQSYQKQGRSLAEARRTPLHLRADTVSATEHRVAATARKPSTRSNQSRKAGCAACPASCRCLSASGETTAPESSAASTHPCRCRNRGSSVCAPGQRTSRRGSTGLQPCN